MTSELAPELREFLYRYCPTLPGVEALVLVQSKPEVGWTARLLGGHVGGLDEKDAADLLATFHWHGFLAAKADGTYRYQPRTAELDRLATRLVLAHANERLAVLTELANLASLTPIRNFAEAFRIRKGRPGG